MNRVLVENIGDQISDGLEFRAPKATRCSRGCSEPDTRRDRRPFRIERNAVLVACQIGAFECLFRGFSRDLLRPQIDEDDMRISSAGHDGKAPPRKRSSQPF